MFGGLTDSVLRLVKRWQPEKNYRSEKGFEEDLYNFLRRNLKSHSDSFGFGTSSIPIVQRQIGSGRSRADIGVRDRNSKICIELKRNLTTSISRSLKGQIDDYKDFYSCIIVVICGAKDESAWDSLVNKYSGSGMGIGLGAGTPVHLVRVKKGSSELRSRRKSVGLDFGFKI